MKQSKLIATYQKSYYGKATIFEDENFIVLRSYNTDVVAIDKSEHKIIRLWNGWSVTTAKHINDFLKQNGYKTISKKEWLEMPCINSDTVYHIYLSNGFYTHKSNILLTELEAENEINRIMENRPHVVAWYE